MNQMEGKKNQSRLTFFIFLVIYFVVFFFFHELYNFQKLPQIMIQNKFWKGEKRQTDNSF